VDADEAIERAVALAATLGGEGGGDDVDMRLVGQILADCKDARTEAASEAAWSLYEAAVLAGTAAKFNIRQYNFALGAVQHGPAGEGRVKAVWDALVTAVVPPNAVTLSQLAHGLCKGAKDVPGTLAALRECASRGAAVDAYVLNILLNACLREMAAAGADADVDLRATVRESALAVWEAGKGIHNERTLTSTIKVLADAGDVDAAVRTFRSAWEDNVPLDVDALATALRIMSVTEPAAVLIGVMNMAQEQRGLVPSTMCANIVLAACSKDGEFSTALTLWRHMLERRMPPPDKASLASVILACGREGRVDLALEAFEEGKKKGRGVRHGHRERPSRGLRKVRRATGRGTRHPHGRHRVPHTGRRVHDLVAAHRVLLLAHPHGPGQHPRRPRPGLRHRRARPVHVG
jgi:pentatricopeptide repeat protein